MDHLWPQSQISISKLYSNLGLQIFDLKSPGSTICGATFSTSRTTSTWSGVDVVGYCCSIISYHSKWCLVEWQYTLMQQTVHSNGTGTNYDTCCSSNATFCGCPIPTFFTISNNLIFSVSTISWWNVLDGKIHTITLLWITNKVHSNNSRVYPRFYVGCKFWLLL